MISLIVAVAQNGVIGKDGKIPWKLSTDLVRFKHLTTGCALIMGRKTYQSIGKPLPKRKTIVLTGSYDFASSLPVEVSPAKTLQQALEKAKMLGYEEAFICGGTNVYLEAVTRDLVDMIYVTHIEADFDGDAFFPEAAERLICPPNFRCTFEELHPANAAFPYRYWFFDYKRVR